MPANDYAARPRRGDAVATIRTARLLMNSEAVPPTAADPFANQPHAIVERDGVRYTLLGTAPVSKDSVSAVRAAIASDDFDAVAVELDAQRLQALGNPETPAQHGRASCRERVGQKVEITGVAGSCKQK